MGPPPPQRGAPLGALARTFQSWRIVDAVGSTVSQPWTQTEGHVRSLVPQLGPNNIGQPSRLHRRVVRNIPQLSEQSFPRVAGSEVHMCLRCGKRNALNGHCTALLPRASRSLASGCCTTVRSHQSHCSTRSLHRRGQSDLCQNSGAIAPSDTWLSRKMSSSSEALVATKHALGKRPLPMKENGVCVKIPAQASMTSAHRKHRCDPELCTACKQSGGI